MQNRLSAIIDMSNRKAANGWQQYRRVAPFIIHGEEKKDYFDKPESAINRDCIIRIPYYV